MAIRHKKHLNRADDGTDPDEVHPSDWNEEHEVDGLLGVMSPLAVVAEAFPYIAADGTGAMASLTTPARALLAGSTYAEIRVTLGAAPLNNPAFTGVPTAPTAALGANSDQLATMAALKQMRDDLVNAAPGALDTLRELADALGDDPNFATTVSAALGNRLQFDAFQSLSSGQKEQAVTNLGLATVSVSGSYSDLTGLPTLGTAAALNAGTGADQLLQLDGDGKLPAVDGSAVTNVQAQTAAFGFTNRIINPSGQIWQRQNSGAGAISDGVYAFDRWYGLTQSAGVTAAQLSAVEPGAPSMMRLLQANATAQRFGLAQVIENVDCADLFGRSVTLSARARMSIATTLRYAILEWSGTADVVTKDFVNIWTNTTFTPGQFFAATNVAVTASGSVALAANTLASISLTGNVGTSANNIAVFFWTDSAQAQNVTLDVGKVQLELGGIATPLARRAFSDERRLCRRFYQVMAPGVDAAAICSGFCYSSTFAIMFLSFEEMRMPPAISASSPGHFGVLAAGISGIAATTIAATVVAKEAAKLEITVASGLLVGSGAILRSLISTARMILDAEI